jgi:hypothetical protein
MTGRTWTIPTPHLREVGTLCNLLVHAHKKHLRSPLRADTKTRFGLLQNRCLTRSETTQNNIAEVTFTVVHLC